MASQANGGKLKTVSCKDVQCACMEHNKQKKKGIIKKDDFSKILLAIKQTL